MAAPRAPPGDSLFTADGALIATTVKIVLPAGPTHRNPEFPGLGVVVTVAVRAPLGSSSKRTLLGSITSVFTASGPAGPLSGIVTGRNGDLAGSVNAGADISAVRRGGQCGRT